MASITEVLPFFLHCGAVIGRVSRPHEKFELDGAEGVRIWRMTDDDEDALEEHAFAAEEIVAVDWEVRVIGSGREIPAPLHLQPTRHEECL